MGPLRKSGRRQRPSSPRRRQEDPCPRVRPMRVLLNPRSDIDFCSVCLCLSIFRLPFSCKTFFWCAQDDFSVNMPNAKFLAKSTYCTGYQHPKELDRLRKDELQPVKGNLRKRPGALPPRLDPLALFVFLLSLPCRFHCMEGGGQSRRGKGTKALKMP
jgi:hypothetical protein